MKIKKLDLNSLAITQLVWMIALINSEIDTRHGKQLDSNKLNSESVNQLNDISHGKEGIAVQEKVGEIPSNERDEKVKAVEQSQSLWFKIFPLLSRRKSEDHTHFNKYRPPIVKRIYVEEVTTTTEFIPDDPEDVTDPATPWPKIEPPLDHLNPPVRMPLDAKYKNGTPCNLNHESSQCWSDGNCRWFEICKTTNCVTSCQHRKGKEWRLAKHDSVGLDLKSIALSDP